MTNWITLQLADLNNYLAAPQVHALETAALAAGQSGRFNGIMTDVVRRIRVKIQGNPRILVSATDATLPPELKWAACLLILQSMQAALPGFKLSDDQRSQVSRAEDQLRRICDGLEPVTLPNDPLVPTNVQRGGQVQLVTRSRKIVSRRQTRTL